MGMEYNLDSPVHKQRTQTYLDTGVWTNLGNYSPIAGVVDVSLPTYVSPVGLVDEPFVAEAGIDDAFRHRGRDPPSLRRDGGRYVGDPQEIYRMTNLSLIEESLKEKEYVSGFEIRGGSGGALWGWSEPSRTFGIEVGW